MNAGAPAGGRILILQTSFPGDVVLTLPLAQELKRALPASGIDMIVIPSAAGIPEHHPAIREIIVYDKRGGDSGLAGFLKMLRRIRSNRYTAALVPHRSIRSALLPYLARIPIRVGFNRSAGWFLFNRVISYDRGVHEIKRNCQLLSGLGISVQDVISAKLYPGAEEIGTAGKVLAEAGISPETAFITVAPGSVWETKRWPDKYFAEVIRILSGRTWRTVLIGGKEDAGLCEQIRLMAEPAGAVNTAGRLSFLGSAEVIRRSTLLLTNDTAPLHLAGAVGTRIAAIFGATVTRFGFGPTNPGDRVLEIEGLPCRPCSIHGGKTCPIGTFPCMLTLRPADVADKILEMLNEKTRSTSSK